MKDDKINLDEDLEQEEVEQEESSTTRDYQGDRGVQEGDVVSIGANAVSSGSVQDEKDTEEDARAKASEAEIREEITRSIMAEKKKDMSEDIKKEVEHREGVLKDYVKRYEKFRKSLVEKYNVVDLELKSADGLIADFKTSIKDPNIQYANKLRFAVKAITELKGIQNAFNS